MSSREYQRRVVVTGLGIAAPNGIGQQAFWQALQEGRSGIRSVTSASPIHSGLQVAGTMPDFLAQHYVERKLINRTDRMTHLALAALQEAVADAELEPDQLHPQRTGVVLANTMGGVDYVLRQLETLYQKGPHFVSAYTAIAWLHVATVGQIAIRYGLQGYSKTPVNDMVSGLDALGMAFRALRRGVADVIIAGGCEAMLNPFVLQLLATQDRYYAGNDLQGYRPFDRRASGVILAEGAGICILEEYEHARQRGAQIYGELVGYAQTNEAHDLHGPGTQSTQYARALRLALDEQQLRSADLAYIGLDGQATAGADAGEVAALQRTFGESYSSLPVSVPRASYGHSYAAAGALDAITALLALRKQMLPPTITDDRFDPAFDLHLITTPQPFLTPSNDRPRAILLGSRGTGGVNVALALREVLDD